MSRLKVTVERYVDSHQPGFVEFSFIDANGIKRSFVEKVPVLTQEPLWQGTSYPHMASLNCTVVSREFLDCSTVLVVDIANPDGVEDEVGNSLFRVSAGLVTE